VPRNSRRDAKGCACRARSVVSIIASPRLETTIFAFQGYQSKNSRSANWEDAYLRCNNFKQPMTAVGQTATWQPVRATSAPLPQRCYGASGEDNGTIVAPANQRSAP